MPFKIVQTIENSKISLAVVPSSWEENGTLFWPNKGKHITYKMQKMEDCIPVRAAWERSSCIKKREFASFEEAEKECTRMEENSDTEDIETYEIGKRRKRHKAVSEQPHHTRLTSLDLNYLMQVPASNSLESYQQEVTEKPEGLINFEVIDTAVEYRNEEESTSNNNKVVIIHDHTLQSAAVSEAALFFTLSHFSNNVDILPKKLG